MDRWEDPEDAAATAACQKCGEFVLAEQLQRCPWCFQFFCVNCRFSLGEAEYCSSPCAEAMFHVGEGDDGTGEE